MQTFLSRHLWMTQSHRNKMCAPDTCKAVYRGAPRVGQEEEFLVVKSESQQGGDDKSHQPIFTLDALLPQLLTVLYNLFVFTNNFWPREIWREWGHY